MNNDLKFKTRLTFIQIIFEHLSTCKNIFEIYDVFNDKYKSTFIENFNNKKKIKFEFNSNFLKKLIFFFDNYKNSTDYQYLINKKITFNREFEKWDLINKSILLSALSEIKNSDTNKIKIILNDYLNISKLFITKKDISTINAILDKIIYEKE